MMKKKTAKCIKCGKVIKLYYTGSHETYSMFKGEYTCGNCLE